MRASALFLRLVLAVSLLALPLRPVAPAAHAAEPAGGGEEELVTKVGRSIQDGVGYLKSQQRRVDGSWEVSVDKVPRRGGYTALVLLALLTAGEKPDSEEVQRGLEYLRGVAPSQTYVVGLQTMVFALAKQKVDEERIRANLNWLLRARLRTGWSYTMPGSGGGSIADNSNTQYALLGLHEAIQAGGRVDPRVLEEIRELYLRTQLRSEGQPGGGWDYRPAVDDRGRPGGAATMTMTSAGLCNLLIAGMDLAVGKAVLRPDGSAEACGEYRDNRPVADALAWIGSRFPADLTQRNAVARLGTPFYCLYGLERAGRLSGQRYFGNHDWYEVGCRYLVEVQKADGSWEGLSDRLGAEPPLVASSFAVLFLAKGRTPVLISKLAYGSPQSSGWNNKRSDLKHLVEFTSKELFKGMPLAWQAFDVRTKEANSAESRRRLAAELLQSPIVYFNGHDMAPRDKEMEILREYVANGGFILAENCCGKARFPGFDRDFRRLMGDLFPDARLEPLEAEHPVWLASGKFAVSPRDFPLEGIKQGCKTVVIYSPVPLAGYWEGNLSRDGGPGEKAFRLGANIIAYATGLEAPRPRLTKVAVSAEDAPDRPRRGFLRVAQLRHEGDWQPAPRAMRALMEEARREGLDVVLQTQPVHPTNRSVVEHRFLYMHGRNAFSENKADLKHLRFVLKAGGTLLADACCGSPAFDRSFRRLVNDLFADDRLKLEPIPVADDLYSEELNGEAIATVRLRQRGPGGRVESDYRVGPPQLEGIKYHGRWVVIYSRNDLGCALEKHTSPDCVGHDHASALKLARAALLYALKR